MLEPMYEFRETIIDHPASKELGLTRVIHSLEHSASLDDLEFTVKIFSLLKNEYSYLEEKYSVQLPLGFSIFTEAVLGGSFDSLRWELDKPSDSISEKMEESDIVAYNKITRSVRLMVQAYLHYKYRALAELFLKFMDTAHVPTIYSQNLKGGSYPVNVLLPITSEYDRTVINENIFTGAMKRLVYAMTEYMVVPIGSVFQSLKST